jgi:hypothetical protein
VRVLDSPANPLESGFSENVMEILEVGIFIEKVKSISQIR